MVLYASLRGAQPGRAELGKNEKADGVEAVTACRRLPILLAEKLEDIKLTNLDGVEKAILGEVAHQEGRRLRCCIESFPTMARRLGFGERTLRRWSRRLKQAGLLKVQSRRTQTSRATVNWEAVLSAIPQAPKTRVRATPVRMAAVDSGQNDGPLRSKRLLTPVSVAYKGLEEGFLIEGESPRPASQRSRVAAFQEFAVETWQVSQNGRKPTWGKKDFAALAKVVGIHSEMSPEQLQQVWKSFLASRERFLSKRGHQPADFLSHFDGLRDGHLFERQQEAARREAVVGRLYQDGIPPLPPAPQIKLHATPAQCKFGETSWEQVRELLQPRTNPHTFSTWITPTRGICVNRQTLFVEVPNPLFSRWFRGDGAALVADALRESAPRLTVEYLPSNTFAVELVVGSQADGDSPSLSSTASTEPRDAIEPGCERWTCPEGCIPLHATRGEHEQAIIVALQRHGFIGELHGARSRLPAGVMAR